MTVAARAIHHASLLIIPHPANDYRPWALRHKPLAALSILLIAAKIMAVVIIGLTPAMADLSTITSARMLQFTNEERSKRGLSALTSNDKLVRAAQAKGEDMLAHQYFAHISPAGVTPWFWMAKQDYTYQVAGENLAIDFTEAEDVVTAWINSPTHKENMLLPDYTETGIAVVTGEFNGATSTIVVHFFGEPPAGRVAAVTRVVPTIAPVPVVMVTPLPLPSATPDASSHPKAPVVPPNAPQKPPTYIISPQSDQGTVVSTDGMTVGQLLSLSQSKALLPVFNHTADDNATRAPARFQQLTRRMFLGIVITISILLVLAIVIRIRVQRPALIAHASLVILLAVVLLFH